MRSGFLPPGDDLLSADANCEYADEHTIRFPLLSDTDSQVSQAYGVLTEEFENHRDVPRRAMFVIDPDRVVQFAWSARNPDEQPDLDALRKATNCRDGQCAIDESEESV